MVIIFDTETTGKPLDYKAHMTDLNNWPRVIQLGWATYTADGELIDKSCTLIKPNGWVVPKEKFWIDNGYSTEDNEAYGIAIDIALSRFVLAMAGCDVMVAHNIAFDYPVLGAEMLRAGIRSQRKLKQTCTMEAGTDFCKLRSSFQPGYKWPTLGELHQRLFGTSFEKAHDAGADVAATAKCFFQLKNLGVIRI